MRPTTRGAQNRRAEQLAMHAHRAHHCPAPAPASSRPAAPCTPTRPPVRACCARATAQDEAHCLSDDNTQQVHAPHACDANAPKQLLSRRSLGVAVASAWATGRQLSAPGQATAAAAPAAAQLRACPPLLSLPLATAFTGAAYDALVALQVGFCQSD